MIEEVIYFLFDIDIINNKISNEKRGSGCAVVPINIQTGNNALRIEERNASGRFLSGFCLNKKKNKITG